VNVGDRGIEQRWRLYQEERALDGRALRLLTAVTTVRVRSSARRRRAPLVPTAPATATVVIPCFNYGRFLPDAVRSALAQPHVDVEVIIVDDCSTDDSRQVARRLAAEHAGVTLIEQAVNSGHVECFNAGWRASSGEFVVKLDADDMLTEGALTRAVALFRAHPTVGLVYGHPRHFHAEDPPPGRVARVRWTVWAGQDWLAERCRLGSSAITNPEMVVRSGALRELGAMDPRIPYAPDMELSLRVAASSDVGYVAGADQALHREHASSMSETDGSGTLLDLCARRAAFDAALQRTRGEGSVAMRAAACRALGREAVRLAMARSGQAGRQDEVAALLAFAIETHPESAQWRAVRRLRDGRGARRSALVRAWGRAARKIRYERYYARWVVSGL